MTLLTVPTGVPSTIVAGDSAVWDDPSLTHVLYGAFSSTAGWTLTYRLTARSAQLEVVAATQGDGWRTTLTADQTRGLKDTGGPAEPEPLRYTAQLTQGTDAITVRSGFITLEPDPTLQQDGYQSHAQTMLGLVRTAIQDLVTRGVKSAAIQGRAYTKNDLAELTRLEAKYLAQVQAEQRGSQFGIPIAGVFRDAGGATGGWSDGALR